jgi:hypothetical protein
MTDRRTDFELRTECTTCVDALEFEVSPVKRHYWKARYRKAADELRDRDYRERVTLQSFTNRGASA